MPYEGPTKQIGFTFSLLNRGVVGPSTHEIACDVHAAYVSSFENALNWNYGPFAEPSVTFDLGVNGMLDVTFLPSPARHRGPFNRLTEVAVTQAP